MPDIFRRGLRFVPVATLTALVVPALVFQAGQLNLSAANERLLAGGLAAIVAYFSKNVLLTISVGMTALWLLQWLGV
jgi:branched-subunit amino acid transport protein